MRRVTMVSAMLLAGLAGSLGSGLAVSPAYAKDQLVYAYFTSTAGDNRIARFKLGGKVRPILTGLRSAAIHNGGRIAFGPDGMLYAGTGDASDGEQSQNPADVNGKILRLTRDGKPAPGNPTPGSPVWSMGHRNVQGLAWGPDSKMYAIEFGQDTWDEVNVIEPGKNYGWPVITYGRDYSGAEIGEGTAKEGLEQPLYYWDPSIAPGAVAIYRGKMFPEWNGDFLVAALKFKLLSRMQRDDTGAFVAEERMFDGDYGRMRDVVVAPDGALLIVTDEDDGALIRVSRSPDSNG